MFITELAYIPAFGRDFLFGLKPLGLQLFAIKVDPLTSFGSGEKTTFKQFDPEDSPSPGAEALSAGPLDASAKENTATPTTVGSQMVADTAMPGEPVSRVKHVERANAVAAENATYRHDDRIVVSLR